MVAPATLILTVTRACNLRCSYCPTAKDGWPSLDPDDVRAALALFVARFGGGVVKLFGGEPLLNPAAVRAALDWTGDQPAIRRIMLSTNGLGLDADWLDRLAAHPKAVLTISMDGRPGDHRRLRRALPGVPDAHDHLLGLLPQLLETPRVVITQTIAPATAPHTAENFRYLVGLGFRRFNLLPGYFIGWRPERVHDLRRGFGAIGDVYEKVWAEDGYLYLRNLFTRAPTPFFNTGLVVDSDRTIHPSNVGLSGSLEGLRGRTALGSLDEPPTTLALAAAAAAVPQLLADHVDPAVWAATQQVDAELTTLCRRLTPAWAAWRKRRAA